MKILHSRNYDFLQDLLCFVNETHLLIHDSIEIVTISENKHTSGYTLFYYADIKTTDMFGTIADKLLNQLGAELSRVSREDLIDIMSK